MKNITSLSPNIIIGNTYEAFMNLGILKELAMSSNPATVVVQGVSVDYVKISTTAQINAINYIVQNEGKIRDAILAGLMREYPNLKDMYEDDMPDITDQEQLKEFVGILNIHINAVEKDDVAYVGFELDCSWDVEHGVGIMMHQDKVIAMGDAETAWGNNDLPS